MRWNKPNIRNSLHSLLGRDAPASTGWVRDQDLEEVRSAMLRLLADLSGSEVARMGMRLRYAPDMEALWYLRSDLLNTVAEVQGSLFAAAALQDITALFQALQQQPCTGADEPPTQPPAVLPPSPGPDELRPGR
jgi:hypothetical protein